MVAVTQPSIDSRAPAAGRAPPTVASVGMVRSRNQQKILSAAECEFDEFGFAGARLLRIAKRAGLPKANIYYYFDNKLKLYGAVLSNILQLWNTAFDAMTAADDPAIALAAYIRQKMDYSRSNPRASRIFASEILRGAPNLSHFLERDLRQWVSEKAAVITTWSENGKMAAVDPYHLIFLIWGATQHYADYRVQIAALQGKSELSAADFAAASDSLIEIILRGCGLALPTDEAERHND